MSGPGRFQDRDNPMQRMLDEKKRKEEERLKRLERAEGGCRAPALPHRAGPAALSAARACPARIQASFE